jgi:hypothetical protein
MKKKKKCSEVHPKSINAALGGCWQENPEYQASPGYLANPCLKTTATKKAQEKYF